MIERFCFDEIAAASETGRRFHPDIPTISVVRITRSGIFVPGMIDQAAGHVRIAGTVHRSQPSRSACCSGISRYGSSASCSAMASTILTRVERSGRCRATVPREDLAHLRRWLQQLRQPVLDAEVGAIPDRILGDEDDFLCAIPNQVDNLLEDVDWGFADLAALDRWDRTKAQSWSQPSATLTYAEGPVWQPLECGQHAFATGDFRQDRLIEKSADDIANLEPFLGREDMVHASWNVAR